MHLFSLWENDKCEVIERKEAGEWHKYPCQNDYFSKKTCVLTIKVVTLRSVWNK